MGSRKAVSFFRRDLGTPESEEGKVKKSPGFSNYFLEVLVAVAHSKREKFCLSERNAPERQERTETNTNSQVD